MESVPKQTGSKCRVLFSIMTALLLVATVGGPGCGGKGVKEVSVGALLSLTGDWSYGGECAQVALHLAVEDVNEYLVGIGSRTRVGVVAEDTGTDPATALQKLANLVDKGIKIVIGPQTSAELAAVKGQADQEGILLISPSSTAPSLAIPGDNVFRFCPSDTGQAEAIANLMWQDGVRIVLCLSRDDLWGNDLAGAVKGFFEKKGGTVPEGVKYDPATEDFSTKLDALSTKATQAIAGYGAGAVGVHLVALAEASTILADAQNYPILSSAKWYGCDGIALDKGLVANEQAALFAIATGFPNPIYGGKETERYGQVVQRIQDRIGRPPDAYAVAAYDALWVVALTYLSTGDTGDSAVLQRALVQTAESFFGATGWTGLTEAGDRKSWDYDFWAIAESDGVFSWKRVARYQVDPDSPEGVMTELGFPSRPIRIITGWLGGTAQFLDAIAREAKKALGVPVTVVNEVGNEGLDAVVKFQTAPQDGYTLLAVLDFDTAYFARGRRDINPAEDWVPILIGNMAVTQIYIRPDDPRYSNWDELVAYARTHPGLKAATISTPLDLEGLYLSGLEKGFGIKFEEISYDKSPERNASLMSETTDLLIDQPGDVKDFIDTGKFKPILTLWKERVKGFENVPTAAEKGVDLAPLWRMRGIVAPKGTPQDRIEKLQYAFSAAFHSEGFQQQLQQRAMDLTPYPDDPAGFMSEQVKTYQALYESMSVETVKADMGQQFSIVLDSGGIAGYTWQLAAPVDKGMLQLLGSDEERWTFQAVGRGEAMIFVRYVPAGQPDAPAAMERTFVIIVK